MRFPRFNLMSIAMLVIAMIIGGFALSTSTAQAGEDDLKAVYPNFLLPGIQQACPKGSQKVFKVELSVPRGSRIVQARQFVLVAKDKRVSGGKDVLTAKPYRVNRRLVEYYLFPLSPDAKVWNLRDMRRNLAYVDYTSHEYTAVLSKDCIIKE